MAQNVQRSLPCGEGLVLITLEGKTINKTTFQK